MCKKLVLIVSLMVTTSCQVSVPSPFRTGSMYEFHLDSESMGARVVWPWVTTSDWDSIEGFDDIEDEFKKEEN